MSPITIQAQLTVKEGSEQAVTARLLEASATYKTHKGTLEWYVMRNSKKPLEFSIVERYEDQAAIDAHVQSRYYVETGAFLKEHIDKFSLEFFEDLAGSAKL